MPTFFINFASQANKTMKTTAILLAAGLVSFGARAFTTDTISVNTALLSSPEKVVVIVPDKQPEKTSFPTVYLLNGYGGDHTSWLTVRPDLGELADEYGMVMVMPDGRDSWYWDSPVQPDMQMESFITKELVPYIDANYPTLPVREKRAVTGLSMGGHGALWLAANHPDLFGNAGAMSGGVDIRPFPGRWKMAQRLGSKEEFPERWENSTVANCVPKLKEAKLNITFDCGKDDFFAAVNDNLHTALLEADVPHDYTSRPGKHTRTYWNNSILYHLLFFNEAFNK